MIDRWVAAGNESRGGGGREGGRGRVDPTPQEQSKFLEHLLHQHLLIGFHGRGVDPKYSDLLF